MNNAAMRDGGEVACLVLPLDDCDLLVPNDCVAEVMPWRRSMPAPGLPRWCLGTLVWRNQTVVVVDFSILSGKREEPGPDRRALVVMNRITVRDGCLFYALSCAGLPRIFRATEEELRDAPAAEICPGALAAIRFGADTVFIPDLRHIEDQVNGAF